MLTIRWALEENSRGKNRGQTGVLNLSQFMGLFFTLFLFPEGGMVGKRAVKSRFILSSLTPAYPPYK